MATYINNNFDLGSDAISEVHAMKFGLVVSTWNKDITDNLCDGAYKTLLKYGAKDANIKKIEVPGSFELIYGCKKMQQSYDMLDAVIAVGSVIQGQTKHFDFVCEGVTQGIKDLNIQSDIPV